MGEPFACHASHSLMLTQLCDDVNLKAIDLYCKRCLDKYKKTLKDNVVAPLYVQGTSLSPRTQGVTGYTLFCQCMYALESSTTITENNRHKVSPKCIVQ